MRRTLKKVSQSSASSSTAMTFSEVRVGSEGETNIIVTGYAPLNNKGVTVL